MDTIKILAFSGSLRQGSFNTKLLRQACQIFQEKDCHIVNFISLKDLNLPLYDGDLEEREGMPKSAQKLVDQMLASDAFVIASPEYNGGITGVLKNAIDWASRSKQSPFVGKPILLVGTSVGWFGAVKSHMITRMILTHLRAIVVPSQICIPQAEKAMDAEGKLQDLMHAKLLRSACDELIQFAQNFKKKA